MQYLALSEPSLQQASMTRLQDQGCTKRENDTTPTLDVKLNYRAQSVFALTAYLGETQG